jgi:hypothetical protein
MGPLRPGGRTRRGARYQAADLRLWYRRRGFRLHDRAQSVVLPALISYFNLLRAVCSFIYCYSFLFRFAEGAF